MKVAVIGAGIYGITIANKLAADHNVTLFEAEDNILKCASFANQFRIHKGYHYPRSIETTLSSFNSEPSFKEEYTGAIIGKTSNYYAIAKENSLTSSKSYLKFLNKFNLPFKISSHPLVNSAAVSLCIEAKENLIDPYKLREISYQKIKANHINLKLNTLVTAKIFEDFDYVIICTYAKINELISPAELQKDYQYELCEQPVIKLPKSFHNQSIVILDGPFVCIDPYGQSGFFLLYDVRHSIHNTNIGKNLPELKEFKGLINKGMIKNPPITNFKKIMETAEYFMPKIKEAKHIGSLFTFRAVQPYKDGTDERLTSVRSVHDNVYTVFSGKIVNCVVTAEHVKNLIENRHFVMANTSSR